MAAHAAHLRGPRCRPARPPNRSWRGRRQTPAAPRQAGAPSSPPAARPLPWAPRPPPAGAAAAAARALAAVWSCRHGQGACNADESWGRCWLCSGGHPRPRAACRLQRHGGASGGAMHGASAAGTRLLLVLPLLSAGLLAPSAPRGGQAEAGARLPPARLPMACMAAWVWSLHKHPRTGSFVATGCVGRGVRVPERRVLRASGSVGALDVFGMAPMSSGRCGMHACMRSASRRQADGTVARPAGRAWLPMRHSA